MKPMSSATFAGIGLLLALAACGGRLDDAAPAAASSEARDAAPIAPRAVADAPSPSPASASAATVRAAPEPSLGELRQEVALLRREVSDLRQQLMHAPGAGLVGEAAIKPRTDPSQRQEAQNNERLRVATAESAFRNESSDARWSQGAATSVRSALSEADPALMQQVRSIECRSQTCRVELAAPANGPVGQELPVLLSRLAGSLPNVTAGQVDQGNGHQATVLYLSR